MLTRGVGVASPIMYRAKGCLCVYVDRFLGKRTGSMLFIEHGLASHSAMNSDHDLPGIHLRILCLATPDRASISRVSVILAVWFGE